MLRMVLLHLRLLPKRMRCVVGQLLQGIRCATAGQEVGAADSLIVEWNGRHAQTVEAGRPIWIEGQAGSKACSMLQTGEGGTHALVFNRSRATKGERWHLTWTCDFVLATKLPSIPRACSPGGAVIILRKFMRYIHTGRNCVRVVFVLSTAAEGPRFPAPPGSHHNTHHGAPVASCE